MSSRAPKYSIFSLIYRSSSYATFLNKYIQLFTPELETGEAEFYFILNNAKPKLAKSIAARGIPHFLHEYSVSGLPPEGLNWAKPKYLQSVYAAYNFGARVAKGDTLIMLNSDMVPSPDWLGRMQSEFDPNTALVPSLIEPFHPKYGIFPGAIEGDFGHNPSSFEREKWLDYCKTAQLSKVGTTGEGLPFMPLMISKESFLKAGGFPHGNLVDQNGKIIPGDRFFMDNFERQFGEHRGCSISVPFYHFKEGEKSTELWFHLRTRLVPKFLRSIGVNALVRFIRNRSTGVKK